MVFKVYYQESESEMFVRENTKVLYVEADSERDVRIKLKGLTYNIEYIQLLEGAHLEYEKQSESFVLQENA